MFESKKPNILYVGRFGTKNWIFINEDNSIKYCRFDGPNRLIGYDEKRKA